MSLSFPSNPTTNQTYTYSGITYTYDGKRWVATTNTVSEASTNVTLANVAPSNPATGQLWLNQDNGTVAVYALGGWVSIGSIMSSIAAGSVTGAMLADKIVTAAKIADSTITSTQITNSTITGAKLADKTVTAAKIADGAITTLTISDFAITSQKLANTITVPNLTVSGNLINSGLATLGDISNIKISGGTSGQLLSTDGTGNLSFITNSVPTELGNITVSNAAVFSNTASFAGAITANAATFSGLVTVTQSAEVIASKTGATGVVAHDLSTATTFYHTSPAANFTCNFTNVSTTNDRVLVAALVISQGATPYVPTAVQIDGSAQTIKWISSTAPTGTASKIDIISFSLLRSGGAWIVMGQNSNYG